MKVLSLCDGMSCGQIALKKAGIPVDKYYASEIKDIGIRVTKSNFPDTVHIGDLTKVSYSNGVLHTEYGDYKEQFDLVIFGSPCQSFSVAMRTEMRTGLQDTTRSGLFFDCLRVLDEVKPLYFLMENVGTMKDTDRDLITICLDVQPLSINSSLVSAQLRRRHYWTNIPGVTKPLDRNITLQSILTDGYTDRTKARALVVSESRPLVDKSKLMKRYTTTGMLTLVFGDLNRKDSTCRILNQIELERLQNVPEGYTKTLSRNQAANVLGDGWTVDVIAHIFSFLPKQARLEG
jgi:site-specific DNA-cytosine methylase